jgi:uncharacterized protein
MTTEEERFSNIDPANRILLLSHCLRPSQSCTAKYDKKGLICTDDCKEDCVIGRLRKAALALNYKGVCIAPGGSLAIKYVKETKPAGIVAIACKKELQEGVESVGEISDDSYKPVIVSVPLTKDGCVDTEVDEKLAEKTIYLGYSSVDGKD